MSGVAEVITDGGSIDPATLQRLALQPEELCEGKLTDVNGRMRMSHRE